MRKKIFLSLILMALSNNLIFACDCDKAEDPKLAFSKADVVFVGHVVEICKSNFRKIDGVPSFLDNSIDVKFRITEKYKGALGKEITVTTPDSFGSCGYPFEPNNDYLVYGNYYLKDSSIVETSICTRTANILEATEDLKVLITSITSK